MKCAAMVWHGWQKFPCTRNAKRLVGTAHYCEQHARIEERRKGDAA